MRKPKPAPPCPNADQHTPQPFGYVAWDLWAEEMSRTHHQIRCTGCDLFQIWIPTPGAPTDLPSVDYRLDHKACLCCDGNPACKCRWHRGLVA